MMVLLEDILRKGLSKSICDLILGSYWEDFDKPVPASELSSKTLQYK
jgi:hypothetical protein